jgi:hypothetical protein
VDLYDWLLFLHVLSAFLGVAGMTVLWGLAAGTRGPEPALAGPTASSIGRAAGIAVGVGLMGALLFGIWLAIDVDGYELWDGWILGSLLLWAIAGAAGQRSGVHYQRAADEGADAVALRRSGLQFQVASTAAVALLLVLMIFKPGA